MLVFWGQNGLAQRNPFSSPIQKKEAPKKIQKPKVQAPKKKIVKPEKPQVIGKVFSQNQVWLVKRFKNRVWVEAQNE